MGCRPDAFTRANVSWRLLKGGTLTSSLYRERRPLVLRLSRVERGPSFVGGRRHTVES
jgi:hypothetical protein